MCSLARGSKCWKHGLSFGFPPLSACLKIFQVNYVLIKELAKEPSKLNEFCLSVLGQVQAGNLQQWCHLQCDIHCLKGLSPVQVQGGQRRDGCSGAERREKG